MFSLKVKKAIYPLYDVLCKKPSRFYKVWYKYHNESRSIRGNLRPKNDASSILVFTMHKCASTFTARLLKAISDDTSYIHLNYESYFFGSPQGSKKPLERSSFLSTAFSRNGFIYGPLRYNFNVPNKTDYKILLILRDPRDVLVSYYYYMRYSIGNIDERLLASKTNIDDYVKMKTPIFLKRFQDYKELLKSPYDTYFVKYSDLINNPESTLSSILNHIDVSDVRLRNCMWFL